MRVRAWDRNGYRMRDRIGEWDEKKYDQLNFFGEKISFFEIWGMGWIFWANALLHPAEPSSALRCQFGKAGADDVRIIDKKRRECGRSENTDGVG